MALTAEYIHHFTIHDLQSTLDRVFSTLHNMNVDIFPYMTFPQAPVTATVNLRRLSTLPNKVPIFSLLSVGTTEA